MKTFVGDTVQLNLNTSLVLTGYTCRIKFKRPNGTVGWWDASIDPSNSKIMYHIMDLYDLNMPGEWTVQAHAYVPGGAHLHGEWASFTVMTPLAETSTPPTTASPTTEVP